MRWLRFPSGPCLLSGPFFGSLLVLKPLPLDSAWLHPLAEPHWLEDFPIEPDWS